MLSSAPGLRRSQPQPGRQNRLAPSSGESGLQIAAVASSVMEMSAIPHEAISPSSTACTGQFMIFPRTSQTASIFTSALVTLPKTSIICSGACLAAKQTVSGRSLTTLTSIRGTSRSTQLRRSCKARPSQRSRFSLPGSRLLPAT